MEYSENDVESVTRDIEQGMQEARDHAGVTS